MKRKKRFSASSAFSYKPKVSNEQDQSGADTSVKAPKAVKDSDPFLINDIIFYICQLTLVIIISFVARDYTFNHYSATISDVFIKTHFTSELGLMKKFEEIRSPEQIWEYLDAIFLPLIYRGITGNKSKILAENILIGVPRIRQLRVKMNTCKQAAMFDEFYKTCFDYYREEIEDKEPFGLKTKSWIYREADADERTTFGHFGSYNGGGFQYHFTRDYNSSRKAVKELEDNVWIRYGTRAVIVDFAIFAPNANLLCVAKLLFELIPTGGLVHSSRFYTLKLFLYSTLADYFVLVCELAFCVLTIYLLLVREVCSRNKPRIIFKRWKMLKYLIFGLSLVVIVMTIIRHVVLVRFQFGHRADLVHSYAYRNFDFIINLEQQFRLARCALLVALWIKMLSYLSLFKSVNLILTVFEKVKTELVIVMLMTLSIMTGFAVFGMIVFGDHVVQLYSLRAGLFTLLSLHVGGLYFYEEPEYASPRWAPIFFSAYILLVRITFFNAFVALMVHGYDKAVKSSVEDPKPNFILHELDKIFKLFLGKIKRYDLVRIREMDQTIRKNASDYDALQLILRKHGWPTLDINLIFNQYDVTRGDDLSIDTMSRIYDDVHARNQLFIESESHLRIGAELEKLDKMSEYCDQTTVDIMSKIDALTDKLIKNRGKKG